MGNAVLNSTRFPDCHDLAFLLSAISDVDLRNCELELIEDKGEAKTYIILENIATRPLSDLVLIDTDLNSPSGAVYAWAQRQVGWKVVLRVIVNIYGTDAEVFGLHDE